MQVTKTQARDKIQEIESALQSIAFYIGQQAQPDPHAALRAEYAKQVEEGTTGFYLWELKNSTDKGVAIDYPSWSSDCIYHCTDISCYVSKDGAPAVRMLITEAQELLRTTYDSHDWGINGTMQIKRPDWNISQSPKAKYTYSLKPAAWTGSREDVIALLKEEGLL